MYYLQNRFTQFIYWPVCTGTGIYEKKQSINELVAGIYEKKTGQKKKQHKQSMNTVPVSTGILYA
jgi:hypothetical protein